MAFVGMLFGDPSDEEIEWAQAFLALHEQMNQIVWSVHDAMLSRSPERELRALGNAVGKARRILEDMRKLQEPTKSVRLKARQCFEDGIETYISAYEHGIKWLETQDEAEANQATKKIKVAGGLMDEAYRLVSG